MRQIVKKALEHGIDTIPARKTGIVLFSKKGTQVLKPVNNLRSLKKAYNRGGVEMVRKTIAHLKSGKALG